MHPCFVDPGCHLSLTSCRAGGGTFGGHARIPFGFLAPQSPALLCDFFRISYTLPSGVTLIERGVRKGRWCAANHGRMFSVFYVKKHRGRLPKGYTTPAWEHIEGAATDAANNPGFARGVWFFGASFCGVAEPGFGDASIHCPASANDSRSARPPLDFGFFDTCGGQRR